MGDVRACVVVGNGPSRNSYDLNALKECFTVFGCNALYRDFHPDALGVVDPDMMEEVRNSDYPKDRVVYNYRQEATMRQEVVEDGATRVKVVDRYCSGFMMVRYALDNRHNPVFLIGFDMDSRNIYEGSNNYCVPNNPDHRPDEWDTQIQRLLRTNPTANIFQIGPNTIKDILPVEVVGLLLDHKLRNCLKMAGVKCE